MFLFIQEKKIYIKNKIGEWIELIVKLKVLFFIVIKERLEGHNYSWLQFVLQLKKILITEKKPL